MIGQSRPDNAILKRPSTARLPRLDGRRGVRVPTAPEPAARRSVPAVAAARVAGQEADNDIEAGNDAANDGHEDVADAVDDGHYGSANGPEDGLDLYLSCLVSGSSSLISP